MLAHAGPHPLISEALLHLPPGADRWTPTQGHQAPNQAELHPAIWVARRLDLTRMQEMGADHLPVEAIAIPQTSSLLNHCVESTLSEPLTLDLSKQLSRYFPSHFVAALYELQSILNKIEMKAYVVGGIVRDLLLFEERRLSLNDVDITVEGDALQCALEIEKHSRNFKVDETFPEFGTAILHYKDLIYIDLASTRKERYPHCGALPVVYERGVPLKEDVIRRDFTMNALALSIHQLGEIIDWTGGIESIEAQTIQVLHGASFFEDPSRILRGYKFASRLDFEWTPTTTALAKQFLAHGHLVYKGGGERIKEELSEFLQSPENDTKQKWLCHFESINALKLCHMKIPDPSLTLDAAPEQQASRWARVISRFGQSEKLLNIDIPESESPEDIDSQACHQKWEAYLAILVQHLPADILEKLCLRLILTREEKEVLKGFRKMKDHLETVTPSHQAQKPLSNLESYQLFQPYAFATILAVLIEVEVDESFNQLVASWQHYQTRLAHLKPLLDGHALIDLGVLPGKPIGQALKTLLYARLSEAVSTRLDEIQYVKQHLLSPVDSSALKTESASSPNAHPSRPLHGWDKLDFERTHDGDLADELET
jgi:tRNA nucleotidyltransferase (CCA-adding enzyme)